MISSINTPVRWYDNIFESDRFSSDCDIERFELISDKTRLLPFQFRRPKSGYPISRWFLRKESIDPAIELLSPNDSLFTLDTTFWTKGHWQFVNGKLKSQGTIACNLSRAGILTINKYYTIKIVVSEFYKQVGSLYKITTDYTTTDTLNINGTGTYVVTFKADTTGFSLQTPLTTANDFSVIESIEIKEYKAFDVSIGDIDLPLSELSLVNIDTESDLIQYCGNEFDFQMPCGKYYMMITYGIDTIVYSELITVKDFIPSQSPFTMIEWTNECDLGDIIYQEINGCQYKNRMYVQGELTKPEYPFKEEGEEDGNYKLNITFQKWEKQTSLIVAKCPEFIVDALTGMRLHDTIHITKSIRKKQYEVLAPFEVEHIEYENTSIFNDCATNVELQILLKDKVVDATCCENTQLSSCFDCNYTVTNIDELTGVYYFGNPTEELDFGLYELIDEEYVLIQVENDIVCVTELELRYINLNNEYWQVVPFTSGIVDTDLGGGNHNYKINGYVYPDTYAKVQVEIYDAALGTNTVVIYPGIYTQTDLTAGINLIIVPPANGNLTFSILNYSLNCDYGASNYIVKSYVTLHPIMQDWYDVLVVKPNNETLWAFNNFIQGLDDDGMINEFDLLHILAGLTTNNQMITPLISSSGNNFIANGNFSFDIHGFEGNGADAYIDLKWIASSNHVKYLVNDASIGIFSHTNIQENSIDIGVKTAPNINTSIKARTSLDLTANELNKDITISYANTDSIGMFSASLTGTTRTIYKNGVALINDSYSPAGLSNLTTILSARNNNGAIDSFSSRTYQLVFIGSSNIDQSILYNRFMTLKTALSF